MYVKKSGEGYKVLIEGQAFFLKPAQVDRLLSAFLSEMPHIPERVRMAWSMQIDPRAKIVRTFKCEGDVIVEYYHLEVYIPNHRHHSIYRGPEDLTALNAIQRGFDGYGDSVEITEVVLDLVSQRIAQKELERARTASVVMQRYNMTMPEILKYVGKHKRLPPEVKHDG